MQLDESGLVVRHGVELDGVAVGGVGEDADDGAGSAEVVCV